MSSGFPINILTGKDQSNTSHGYDRPNAVPGASLNLDSSQRGAGQWFNILAVTIQPLGSYGNLGRDVAKGPGIFSMDFSTLKNFTFTEKRHLQFRFEAFNFLNHPNCVDPAPAVQQRMNSAGLPIPAREASVSSKAPALASTCASCSSVEAGLLTARSGLRQLNHIWPPEVRFR